MRRLRLSILVALVLSLAPSLAPVYAQQVTCPPPVGPPDEVIRVRIGHFGEGDAEIRAFCLLLASQNVAAVFVSLGSVVDPRTAAGTKAALEAGRIDSLWINSAALARLLSETEGPSVAKVIAITDFLVVHVVTRDTRLGRAVAGGFAVREVMVAQGRTPFFADALFVALGLPIRCLDVRLNCQTASSEGQYQVFLEERPSRAVIYAAETFRATERNKLALILMQVSREFQLVEIPLETVVRMRPIRGMMTATTIGPGYYKLGSRTDVPPAAVSLAAATDMLVGGSPPEVEARLRQLAARLSQAWLVARPRLEPEALSQSLTMVGELAESLRGRVVLHDEFARKLLATRLLPPNFPASALPVSLQPPPQPPGPQPPGPQPPEPQPPGPQPPGPQPPGPQPPLPPVRVLAAPTSIRPGSLDADPKNAENLYPCRQVSLVWSRVVDAVGYEVTLARRTDPTRPWTVVVSQRALETHLDISRYLSQNFYYRWSVSARDALGRRSAPSQFRHFLCPIG